VTPARLALLKKAALRSVAAKANNPNNAGVSAISLSPHDALKLIEAMEEKIEREKEPA
jgi:hypothetical protein